MVKYMEWHIVVVCHNFFLSNPIQSGHMSIIVFFGIIKDSQTNTPSPVGINVKFAKW